VLVALLVNAWWLGREERAREAQVLDRLHEESEAVVAYFQRILAFHDDLNRSLEGAVAAMQPGGDAHVADLAAFRRGIFLAFTYPAVSPPRSVYDEITGAGRFGDLSSVDVRSAISGYYGRLDETQSRLAFFRLTAQPGIQMTMDLPFAYAPTVPERLEILVEPATLRANQRLYNALVFGLRNQISFQQSRQRLYDDAVVMCETLAAAVGRVCESSRNRGGVSPS
jgi:hypothetical protein